MTLATEITAPDRVASLVGAIGAVGYLMHRIYRYEREDRADQRDEIKAQRLELDELRPLLRQVANLEAEIEAAKFETRQCHREREQDRARIRTLEIRIAELES